MWLDWFQFVRCESESGWPKPCAFITPRIPVLCEHCFSAFFQYTCILHILLYHIFQHVWADYLETVPGSGGNVDNHWTSVGSIGSWFLVLAVWLMWVWSAYAWISLAFWKVCSLKVWRSWTPDFFLHHLVPRGAPNCLMPHFLQDVICIPGFWPPREHYYGRWRSHGRLWMLTTHNCSMQSQGVQSADMWNKDDAVAVLWSWLRCCCSAQVGFDITAPPEGLEEDSRLTCQLSHSKCNSQKCMYEVIPGD